MPTGSCLCKAIKYTYSGDPGMILCHCIPCRRLTGSLFSTNVLIPQGDFTWSGMPKTKSRPGDSGKNITLHFCADCGTTVFEKAASFPGIIILMGGTLDDGLLDDMAPVEEIYVKSRVKWLPKVCAVQKQLGM